MTPKKELFVKIIEALQGVKALKMIDIYRGQFENSKQHYPEILTAAFIRIGNVTYSTMVEHKQEGNATVELLLYFKDGWGVQQNGTSKSKDGLMEIELLDTITDKVQFLQGKQFKPLQLMEETTKGKVTDNIMSYRLVFSTQIHRRTPYPYVPIKLQDLNLKKVIIIKNNYSRGN